MSKLSPGLWILFQNKHQFRKYDTNTEGLKTPFFCIFAENSLSKLNIRKFFFQIVFCWVCALLVIKCANPVSPTGGPEDIEPPFVLKSDPPNNSVFFNKRKIVITFNEFVKLKNPNQQVLISPPLDEMPDFKIRGKSVIISLNSELKENSTYSIFFGDAIVDITEDNPLSNYIFAFSTGSVIDSLSLGGSVVNGFDLKPQESVFVMLYFPQNDTIPADSLPYLIRPDYITKTNKEGFFQLRNLKSQPFKLFALKDVNSNYLFDQPNEEIAFLDSLIIPEMIVFPEPDSAVNDTLVSDSLKMRKLYQNFHQLALFTQFDSVQRILQKEVVSRSKFRVVFKYPAKDPRIDALNIDNQDDWKMELLNRRRDTLMVWVKDKNIDTLDFVISDRDSILDTTQFVLSKVTEDKKKKGKKKEEVVERLVFSANAKGRTIDLDVPLILTFPNPLKQADFSTVFFVAGNDTLTGASFVQNDSLGLNWRLNYKLVENTGYEFIFPDSTLFDIYDMTNDSLQMSFKVKQMSDYGNIFVDLTFENQSYPYIIQLTDPKEVVLREVYAEKPGRVEFKLLSPGKFRFKAIQDSWQNHRWDTGDYLKKRQPENVIYFPAEIQVRANWDVEESWLLP